jgi:hypothetical protein
MLFKITDYYSEMYMKHLKEIIKCKIKYSPVVFNFKTKEIEFEEDMTVEIMINEP